MSSLKKSLADTFGFKPIEEGSLAKQEERLRHMLNSPNAKTREFAERVLNKLEEMSMISDNTTATSNIANNSDIAPELLPYVQKTGGASGGTTNLLIYGGIAAAGLFLLFGNKKKGKGLSGTAKKRKTSVRKTQRRKTTK